MNHAHRITRRMVILTLVLAAAAAAAAAAATVGARHRLPLVIQNASASAHAAAAPRRTVICPAVAAIQVKRKAPAFTARALSCHANIPPGPTGMSGAAGATGATGPVGPTGPSGPAGPSKVHPFRATLTASGTAFASANTVTLYSDGATSLTGHCWTSSGTTYAALGIGSSSPALVNAGYNNTTDPSTTTVDSTTGDYNVMDEHQTNASGTPTAGTIAGPYDGIWSVMTKDGSTTYFTGLGTAGVYVDGSTPCVFAGYTVNS